MAIYQYTLGDVTFSPSSTRTTNYQHTFNLKISHYLIVFNYFNVELVRVCFLKPATVAVIFK